MKQLALNQWPKGLDLSIALLSLAPDAIERRHGIKFEDHYDDLDCFKAALLDLNGQLLVLRKYFGGSEGTEVLISETAKNKKRIYQSLLEAFQITENEISWIHPLVGGRLRRDFVDKIISRLREESPKIQLLHGPRQVGKTTGVRDQIMPEWTGPTHYASADAPESHRSDWLTEQWQIARSKGKNCLLAIDEYQKIENWNDSIKSLWDMHRTDSEMRLILLGSSSPDLKLHPGESLAGRFERTYIPHWSYQELKASFEFDLDKFLLYGGYPGSASYVDEFERWIAYMSDSILKPALDDIQSARPVRNVTELKRVFDALCKRAGADTSYRDLLSEIQSHGNTDTIKHFIDLYEKVYLFKSISKFSAPHHRLSSPRVLPLCPALHTYATRKNSFENEQERGLMLELSVGLDLIRLQDHLSYWRDGRQSVDFVLEHQGKTYGIEVKSSANRDLSGLDAFRKKFPKAHVIILSDETYEAWSRDPLGYIRSLGY